MNEESRPIPGYEGIYEMTCSGRIISKRTNCYRHRNGDEYGFEKVHLNKNGERILFRTFDLWKKTFPEINPKEYKGS